MIRAIKPGCLLLGLLALATSSLAAGASASGKDLERLRERIGSLERRVQSDVARRGRLDRELRSTEVEAGGARKALQAVQAELATVGRQLAALEKEADASGRELAKHRQALAAQVRAAFVSGPVGPLQLLLGPGEAGQAGRHLTYLGYLARSRQEALARVVASIEALQQKRAQLEARRADLGSLESRREQELARIEKARKERGAVVAELRQQSKRSGRELSRLRQQAGDLERVLREVRRALADEAGRKPAGRQPEGRPLGTGRWPVNGKLLAGFGQARAGGQLRWDGVLIGVPGGTPVRAPRSGRVVYADWLPGLGLLLVLDHGSGYLSLYGHNQDLARSIGDRVAAGEVISHVGDTGGQGRPALYFEVRRNGRPQDPRAWVR
jgi:septal ring factor EnvC (AmiA/AmiB activator)